MSNIPAGYKQTEVGVIPEEWEATTIGTIAHFSSGCGISVSALSQDSGIGFPVYGGNGISGYFPISLVDSATVVIGRVGQKCGEVHFTEGPAWITDNALYPVRFKKNIDKSFLSLALRNARLNDARNKNDLPLITQAILNLIPLPLPPLPEQKRIAHVLGDVDALIQKLEALIAKKRDIKQAAMQELLTGKRRLPGFSGAWETKKLGEIIDRFVGGGTPSRNVAAYWSGSIPWVTVKDFSSFNPYGTQEYITEDGLKNSASNLIPRRVVITSTRMALGKAIIFEVDVAINQDLKALYPTKSLTPEYLLFWFEFRKRNIEDLGSGSTVMGISLDEIKKVTFLLPPPPEQTAIAQVLADMDSELAQLETRLGKTRDLKAGLMQQLLTGKIRLKESV